MKHEIPIRIIVAAPLAGVTMMVQRGRFEFLPPVGASGDDLRFEFDITVDVTDAGLNFLGKYAQGPKDSRFIYVNSGKQTGQGGTLWDRRAKLSLMSITRDQIDEAMTHRSVIETSMPGVGKDGGPTSASVKGLQWTVAS